ncbi:hypothetical protein ACTFJT_28670, partial [Klebsiella quasipneumoniae]
ISESAWEEMTCLFAPSLVHLGIQHKEVAAFPVECFCRIYPFELSARGICNEECKNAGVNYRRYQQD